MFSFERAQASSSHAKSLPSPVLCRRNCDYGADTCRNCSHWHTAGMPAFETKPQYVVNVACRLTKADKCQAVCYRRSAASYRGRVRTDHPHLRLCLQLCWGSSRARKRAVPCLDGLGKCVGRPAAYSSGRFQCLQLHRPLHPLLGRALWHADRHPFHAAGHSWHHRRVQA